MLNNSDIFSIWGYCNGFFCFLNIDFGSSLFNLFITNPILGQSDLIKLPRPASLGNDFLAYGLGHCQFTNNYKVLAIITSYGGGEECESVSYILTIGTDKDWRRVLDVNVPCNFKYDQCHGNPQAHMVAFRSALHWIVEPFPMSQNSNLEGGKTYICAFDVTEEKVTAIRVPPEIEVAHHDRFYGQLVILLDKLCVWRFRGARQLHEDIDGMDLWVMDQYGVEGSWTKKFTIEASLLPKDIRHVKLRPLTLSPEGLIVLSDCHNLVIYDFKKNESLKVIHLTDQYYYPIPFIPSFLSVKILVEV